MTVEFIYWYWIYSANNLGIYVIGGCQCALGKPKASKTDDFLEKFQTAFAPPPPHFRKIILL